MEILTVLIALGILALVATVATGVGFFVGTAVGEHRFQLKASKGAESALKLLDSGNESRARKLLEIMRDAPEAS